MYKQYGKIPENTGSTRSYATLEKWCTRYDWHKRAEVYDAALEAAKNERALEIMQRGLALAHERVEKLQGLAEFLHGQMYEQGESGTYHNVWLPDVKEVAGQQVDIERFNAAIVDQFRGTLDDLAKETGGRKVAVELSGIKELLGQQKRRYNNLPDQ